MSVSCRVLEEAVLDLSGVVRCFLQVVAHMHVSCPVPTSFLSFFLLKLAQCYFRNLKAHIFVAVFLLYVKSSFNVEETP